MPPGQRSANRDNLAAFLHRVRPSLQEWDYPMMANKDPNAHLVWRYGSGQEYHRSEWVAWEDDALSACFSWSSQIHHELSTVPHDWKFMPDDGLFMHLNTAWKCVMRRPGGFTSGSARSTNPCPPRCGGTHTLSHHSPKPHGNAHANCISKTQNCISLIDQPSARRSVDSQ